MHSTRREPLQLGTIIISIIIVAQVGIYVVDIHLHTVHIKSVMSIGIQIIKSSIKRRRRFDSKSHIYKRDAFLLRHFGPVSVSRSVESFWENKRFFNLFSQLEQSRWKVFEDWN